MWLKGPIPIGPTKYSAPEPNGLIEKHGMWLSIMSYNENLLFSKLLPLLLFLSGEALKGVGLSEL